MALEEVVHKQVLVVMTQLSVNLLDLELLLQKVVVMVIEIIVVHLALIQEILVDLGVVLEVDIMEQLEDQVVLLHKLLQCLLLYNLMVLVMLVDLEPQDLLVTEVVAVVAVEPVDLVVMQAAIVRVMVVMVIEIIVVHLALIQEILVDLGVVLEVDIMEQLEDQVVLLHKLLQCLLLYNLMVLVMLVDLEPQDLLVTEVVAVVAVEPVDLVVMQAAIVRVMVVMVKQYV